MQVWGVGIFPIAWPFQFGAWNRKETHVLALRQLQFPSQMGPQWYFSPESLRGTQGQTWLIRLVSLALTITRAGRNTTLTAPHTNPATTTAKLLQALTLNTSSTLGLLLLRSQNLWAPPNLVICQIHSTPSADVPFPEILHPQSSSSMGQAGQLMPLRALDMKSNIFEPVKPSGNEHKCYLAY